MNRLRKIVPKILGIVYLLSLFSTLLFIAIEANHEHPEHTSHCQTCFQLGEAHKRIQSVTTSNESHVFHLNSLFAYNQIVPILMSYEHHVTPIRLKVRMNN